jgi:hypothetical protein
MKGQIEKDSIAGQLKAAGVSDTDRVYYMLHGYYPIHDFCGAALKPQDNIVYATSSKLMKASVTGGTWEVAKATVGATGSQQAETKRFRLIILTINDRTMTVDPKRCIRI